jgi:hypothetical protein
VQIWVQTSSNLASNRGFPASFGLEKQVAKSLDFTSFSLHFHSVAVVFDVGFVALSIKARKVDDSARIGGQNQGKLPHQSLPESVRQGVERQSRDCVSLRCFKRRSQSTSPPRYRTCPYSPSSLHSSVMAKGQQKR